MLLDEFEKEQPIAHRILINAIKKNRYSHAYLFESKGYKKAIDIAISFAKMLLCQQNNNYNCTNCSKCHNIGTENNIELKIIEAEGLWIKKEQLIELQQEFNKKAITGTKKIYIINGAEKLNNSSSNSILKFLEEPEENIIAILVVDNQYQLLKTITSRCQKITFLSPKVDHENSIIEKINNILDFKLEDEKINIEEKIEQIITFIEHYEENGKNTLLKTHKLWHHNITNKEETILSFEIMILYYMDVLNKLNDKQIMIFNKYEKSINNTSIKNTINEIIHKINTIIDLKENIRYNMNNQLLIDKLILSLGGEN